MMHLGVTTTFSAAVCEQADLGYRHQLKDLWTSASVTSVVLANIITTVLYLLGIFG